MSLAKAKEDEAVCHWVEMHCSFLPHWDLSQVVLAFINDAGMYGLTPQNQPFVVSQRALILQWCLQSDMQSFSTFRKLFVSCCFVVAAAVLSAGSYAKKDSFFRCLKATDCSIEHRRKENNISILPLTTTAGKLYKLHLRTQRVETVAWQKSARLLSRRRHRPPRPRRSERRTPITHNLYFTSLHHSHLPAAPLRLLPLLLLLHL